MVHRVLRLLVLRVAKVHVAKVAKALGWWAKGD